MAETVPSRNVVVFGEHEPGTLAQLNDVASRAERAALMADGHQGYVMPIGGVAAYPDKVSVVGVGFDIACGNAAIRTARHARSGDRLPAPADEVQDVVSFGVQRHSGREVMVNRCIVRAVLAGVRGFGDLWSSEATCCLY